MCGDGNSFFSGSWKDHPSHPPKKGNGEWRSFLSPGERRSNPKHWPDKHLNPPQIGNIDNSSGVYKAKLINDLFAPEQPWTTTLGAITPDEDFIETYKFKVLTTAYTAVTSLVLTIPTVGTPSYRNVPVDYFTGDKPELERKVNCIPNTL
jgi:hypothetical protein